MVIALAALLLVVLCVLSAFLNLVALPGNWLIVVWVALYALLVRGAGAWDIGWRGLLLLASLALAGEVIELVSGMEGARRGGGSRRAALFAFAGSLGGSLLGAALGMPIPLVGSVLAAVLFGALGAMAGAMVGVWTEQRGMRRALDAGRGAFWGRLTGTIGKFAIGLAMCMATALLLFW